MVRGHVLSKDLVLAVVRRHEVVKSYRKVATELGIGVGCVVNIFKNYDRITGERLTTHARGKKSKVTKEEDEALFQYIRKHPGISWLDAVNAVFPDSEKLRSISRSTTYIFMKKYQQRKRRETIAKKKGIPVEQVGQKKVKTTKKALPHMVRPDGVVQSVIGLESAVIIPGIQERFIWPQIVLFGDDYFQNCQGPGGLGCLLASQLERPYVRRFDILNRGFAGHTTYAVRSTLCRFLPSLFSPDIAAVVVMFGTNDAQQSDKNGPVPVEEYSKNLTDFVDLYLKHGVPANRIILVAPTPCNQEAQAEQCRKNRRSNVTLYKYKVAVQDVAVSRTTQFLDLYGEIMEHPDWRTLFTDGVQLNAFGSKLFMAILWPKLEALLTLPTDVPRFRKSRLISVTFSDFLWYFV
ncbi:isoamyl acetate-hydrolyzing esterase 1 homolog [Paramacrobiotus metropolitanus]|uniref:isoamyl acetate-hydrolyzing esterase 1 homolog n=1 Tax=Paramacrobiotus metropolitanus TaxID=2943436 RepID=UPI0024460EB0|nr:isoamyl acetate-hydrolyzing esterase 1 homolog [Paramacrobiotus metropolitanus]